MKAQLQGQVFIYILTVVIIGMVLLFGGKAILDFIQKGEEVAFIKFKTDLKSIVDSIGPDYQSIVRETLTIGRDYQQVCFTDSASITSPYPTMNSVVGSGTGENTFLVTTDVVEKFDVGTIQVDNVAHQDWDCFPIINGKVRLQFEGMGDKTKISSWNP